MYSSCGKTVEEQEYDFTISSRKEILSQLIAGIKIINVKIKKMFSKFPLTSL